MKTLGIIGGMGPLATIDLMHKIVRFTEAEKDQEHIHILVDCNTNIPDRTAAILHGGENPTEQLLKSARGLEYAGAELLMLACNTAHCFYDDIKRHIKTEILHMPQETCFTLHKQGIKKAGLLATSATVRTGLYQRELEKQNIACVLPSQEGQEQVMGLIYDGIKKGNFQYDISVLRNELDSMENKGAECFILGCTELPIAFTYMHLPYKTIDPTEVLAKTAIIRAGYQVLP